MKSTKSSNIGIIAGGAIGGCVLVVLLLLAVVYGFRQKSKAKREAKKSSLFRKITLSSELFNESALAFHNLLHIPFHIMQNNGALMRAIAASHS